VTFSPVQSRPLGNHTTKIDQAVLALTMMLEGMSIRSIARVTGLHKQTIGALLLTAGAQAATVFDQRVRNLKTRRIQCDEMWGYTYAKRSTVKRNAKILEKHPDAGDAWLWTAIDADSKLIASFHVGDRDAASAYPFLTDLESRLSRRVQITTDSLQAYRRAIDSCFAEVDFAMLHKIYAWQTPETAGGENRYSPPRVVGTRTKVIIGDPNPAHISTSYIERHNLTVRMQLRRFTRLTNGFSKKRIYLEAAVALFMAHYNFCRMHSTVRMTPAMAAGVTDHIWTLQELLTVATERREAA